MWVTRRLSRKLEHRRPTWAAADQTPVAVVVVTFEEKTRTLQGSHWSARSHSSGEKHG